MVIDFKLVRVVIFSFLSLLIAIDLEAQVLKPESKKEITISFDDYPIPNTVSGNAGEVKYFVSIEETFLVFNGADQMKFSADSLCFSFHPYDVAFDGKTLASVKGGRSIVLTPLRGIDCVEYTPEPEIKFNRICQADSLLVLGVCYPFHVYGTNADSRIGFYVFDTKSNVVTTKYFVGNEKFLYLGPTNRKWMDAQGSTVALANPVEGEIHLVNLMSLAVDTIRLPIAENLNVWIEQKWTDEYLKVNNRNIKKIISDMRAEDGIFNYEWILGIDFMNDNQLFVAISVPGKAKERVRYVVIELNTKEVLYDGIQKVKREANPYNTEAFNFVDNRISLIAMNYDKGNKSYMLHTYKWKHRRTSRTM